MEARPAGPAVGAGTAPLALDLPYPVHVGRNVLDAIGAIVTAAAPAHRYAVISDSTVAPLHAARVQDALPAGQARDFTVPAGETEKTRENWAALTDALFAWGAGRDTTVVALGGGVVGDLAGFVAATFMRGIPVVQVPTTLLAMVDAAIGGKTGVDTPHGKNLVGAFHDPRAVVMSIELLETLPEPALRSGLAEIIKHGFVADRRYLAETRAALASIRREGARAPALPALVAGSVRIKAAVVAEDAREGGRRQILNFGHTIGHAIERVLDYRLLHGEAVAIGMVVEARIAGLLGIAPASLTAEVEEALAAAGLPLSLPPGVDPAAVLEATRGDKKNRAGLVRYALPREAGVMESGPDGGFSVAVDDAVVTNALQIRTLSR